MVFSFTQETYCICSSPHCYTRKVSIKEDYVSECYFP